MSADQHCECICHEYVNVWWLWLVCALVMFIFNTESRVSVSTKWVNSRQTKGHDKFGISWQV